MATRYRIFAGVTPGIESLLHKELKALVPDGKATPVEGGVELNGAREDLWHIALYSRLAESLRVRLGRPLETRTFDEFMARMGKLPWSAYLPRGGGMPRITVSCQSSKLYHTEAMAQRMRMVLRDRLGCTDEPGQGRVFLRIVKDQAQVSVDAAGDPMHKRGYRVHLSEAPLRETLAAACLVAADYRGGPLWDPFCGAGTIPLEAANLLAGVPAGGRRKFAFEQWPVHDAEAWAAIKQGVPEPALPDSLIIGSDKSEKALDAARHNTSEAGLEGHVRWIVGDFDQVAEQVPEGATVVCNPPYGLRSQGRLDNVYRRLGQLLGRRFDLRPVVALSGYRELPRLTGRPWRTVHTLSNRGLSVKVLRLDR